MTVSAQNYQFVSFFTKKQGLSQPLYSPDLALCDFFLFPILKSVRKGWRFWHHWWHTIKFDKNVAGHFKRTFPGLLGEVEIWFRRVCEWEKRVLWRKQGSIICKLNNKNKKISSTNLLIQFQKINTIPILKFAWRNIFFLYPSCILIVLTSMKNVC